MNVKENLNEQFIDALISHYGPWERVTSKFGNNSFGKVADELCVSASQFTKLISGTATEGSYIRSIKNITQLKQLKKLAEENNQLQIEKEKWLKSELKTDKRKIGYGYAATLILGSALLAALLVLKLNPSNGKKINSDSFVLSKYFDRDFSSDYISPFLNENNAQLYCPCSAYEGTWKLANDYVIPLPGKKPGLYYVARSSEARLKCLKIGQDENSGRRLIGFEEMQHEIWVDTTLTPLSPKYFDPIQKKYTNEFKNINFENNTDFQKLANVSSFIYNHFNITDTAVYRGGDPSGRFAEDINYRLAQKYELDPKRILEQVVGSLTTFKCNPAPNPYCNPNDLKEGASTLTFDCSFTIKTENLGIGGYPYTKTYILTKQNYSDNLLCACDEMETHSSNY